MPLIFSELASVYPPQPGQRSRLAGPRRRQRPVSAGRTRRQYFSVGGHRAVGREVLEDVALAEGAIKRAKLGLRFRYAPDALSTRMYRSVSEMIEGWTKNPRAALPSPHSARPLAASGSAAVLRPARRGCHYLAARRRLPTVAARGRLDSSWLRTLFRFYSRAARSHFPAADIALSILGVPLFVWLLRSIKLHNRIAEVSRMEGPHLHHQLSHTPAKQCPAQPSRQKRRNRLYDYI